MKLIEFFGVERVEEVEKVETFAFGSLG